MAEMVGFTSAQLSGARRIRSVAQPPLPFTVALFSTCDCELFPVGGASGLTVHLARVLRT